MASARRRTLDDIYTEACTQLDRVTPTEALAEMQTGAVLIDLRTPDNRRRDGIVPGSLHIPRTVLEWRIDVDSPWRSPHVGGLDTRLIVFCDHGYASALAAVTLREIGFERATDLAGGFAAWREAGLPVADAPTSRPPGQLEGSWGPD